MSVFDYNDYNKYAKALDEYYSSVGFNHKAVWDIHEKLGEIYEQMQEEFPVDEEKALRVIKNFVTKCRKIKDAFYYPIAMQECLQVLILIAMCPFGEYESLEMAAYDAAHIFHTHIFHPGE